MGVTRRELVWMALAPAVATFSARSGPGRPARNRRDVALVLAPIHLGLRPTGSGGLPGTWRAPQALMDAGLARATDAREVVRLERRAYEREAQAGTRIRNGRSIRAISLELATHVRDLLRRNRFPVVVGGDCSVLLGCLYGLRLAGGKGLVHVDGHSDFSHPGNYDTSKALGSVAGMDLALATGRGEPLLTEWPEVAAPLVSDPDVVQVGERNSGLPSFDDFYGPIRSTEITMLTVQRVLSEGIDATVRQVLARLESRGLSKIWMHVDLDVLDESVMPAVDSPGSPGLDYAQLSRLAGSLCASGRIAGVDFTIYDPDRDPQSRYAAPLVKVIANSIQRH